MTKPLDEKALWAANKVFNSYLAGQREANGTTRAIIDAYLEARQAGESEAVAYSYECSIADQWHERLSFVKIYESERRRSIKPLYAAHPIVAEVMTANEELRATLAAVQAENERLRERLDIGPNGEDAIDVAESTMGNLRHQIETLRADNERLRDVHVQCLASLVAAVSLLKRSPKTAAPSNLMFDTMIADHEAAIEKSRAALAGQEKQG